MYGSSSRALAERQKMLNNLQLSELAEILQGDRGRPNLTTFKFQIIISHPTSTISLRLWTNIDALE